MTGSKILLDTNIITALLKGEVSVANKIDKTTEVYIPITVMGELYYGALYSTQIQKNIKNLKLLSQNYKLLNIDEETAISYGNIKAKLRKKGMPIPENDIWIAAIANRYNLPLATRDKHFTNIDGLVLKTW